MSSEQYLTCIHDENEITKKNIIWGQTRDNWMDQSTEGILDCYIF